METDMKKNNEISNKYSFQIFKRELPLHIMMIPAIILVIIFSYIPMYGVVLAFQRFMPIKGLFGRQQWVGLENFRIIFSQGGFTRAFRNTLIIASLKIITELIVPVIISLLLNEVRSEKLCKSVQTMVYLPHFISWVILGGIMVDILSPSTGIVNKALEIFGVKPIFFLGQASTFRATVIVTNVWKEFGYGTIIYLAAIMGIDPTLYEAAVIDGANRWQQTKHITLPGMKMVIVLLGVLSLGGILYAGFDQIFNLYNAITYETGDILDTYIYRMGLVQGQYSTAAAVGLFRSVVALILIAGSYGLAYKLADYRIF